MSYQTFEESVHDAAPIECYKFVGSFKDYRYTSADQEVTVNGEVYTPAALKRNGVRAGTHNEETLALELELPFDLAVVTDYAYAESPPKLSLTVYRVHRGTSFATDWALLWTGQVSTFSVQGRTARLRVPSVFSRALQGSVPNVYYQTPCNHVLYDGRCKVSPAAFTQSTTVSTVGINNVVVADDGFADGVLKAGEIINDRNGERRMILGNVADTITIGFPFVDLVAGDTVTLRAGCDLSFSTCKNKFNNTLNFGGQPYIPSDNPFQGSLD